GAHAEARGAGLARGLGGAEHLVDGERLLDAHRGLVVRALRAVGAVLGAAAGLDREQRAELDLVGGVVLAMDGLRAEEELRKRQIGQGANFLQRWHAPLLS